MYTLRVDLYEATDLGKAISGNQPKNILFELFWGSHKVSFPLSSLSNILRQYYIIDCVHGFI